VAYAYVSYQTAYLKRNYTPEFMAALLSSEIDDGNKRDMLVDHIADAKKFGGQVLPPDVNRGEADFTVTNGNIVFGLPAIKGRGRGGGAAGRGRRSSAPARRAGRSRGCMTSASESTRSRCRRRRSSGSSRPGRWTPSPGRSRTVRSSWRRCRQRCRRRPTASRT